MLFGSTAIIWLVRSIIYFCSPCAWTRKLSQEAKQIELWSILWKLPPQLLYQATGGTSQLQSQQVVFQDDPGVSQKNTPMKSKNFTIFSIYKSLHVQLKALAWPKSKPCKTFVVRLEPVSHAHPRPFERVERGLYSTNLWHFSGLMVCALFVLGCCLLNLEIRWGRCWTRLRARSTVHLSDYVKYQAIYIAAIGSMYPFYWEWLLVAV